MNHTPRQWFSGTVAPARGVEATIRRETYIAFTGRLKGMIIRGGERSCAKEAEEFVYGTEGPL